jgi:type I restriction enzyme S subunit
MSKDKLMPEVRFPEFDTEGEWYEKRISELGDTINGLTGKSGDDFGNGRPYVTYKQVFDNSIIVFDKCGKVQISINDNQNTLQKGDILFTTSSETPNEVGFASVLVEEPNEPTYLNSFCFSLRPFDIEEIQPQFSRYLFHSPTYRKSVTNIAQGSTRYNISKGAFLNLKIPLPKPQEQQKIASCLSSLDEAIAAHSQKLELLKEHKKGLMQNLFPQEGEKVPKYRFKEFENDGEWEE